MWNMNDYINDLLYQINSICKIFTDYTSLVSPVHDKYSSQNELSNDLQKMKDLALQWKMCFNPDPSKQAQEVYFSRKIQKDDSQNLILNGCNVGSSFWGLRYPQGWVQD